MFWGRNFVGYGEGSGFGTFVRDGDGYQCAPKLPTDESVNDQIIRGLGSGLGLGFLAVEGFALPAQEG